MMMLLARVKIAKHDLFTSHGRVDKACNELLCAVRSALVDDLDGGRCCSCYLLARGGDRRLDAHGI